MKVLVISVTCGEGHNSTARAIVNKLCDMGITCEFLDAFQYISKNLSKALEDGYLFSTKYISAPYSYVYRKSEKRSKNAEDISSVRLLNTVLASKLRQFVEDYAPDVIITTHCFAAAMIDVLKTKGVINSVNIGVVTDFTAHPFWEESLHFDYLVTASEMLDMQFFKKGFTKEQLLPFGIPIAKKFSKEMPAKQECRKQIGLCPDKRTVLLMSGSMGFGRLYSIVEQLDELPFDFQIIAVCGRNLEAKEEIDGMHTAKRMVTYGYTDNIELLMSASDCIVTKPGGLTSSEALAMGLPLVLVNPIPGQEERNVEFLLNNGAAMAVTETTPLDDVMYQLFSNDKKLDVMKENIKLIAHPDSSERLCEFVKNLK